MTVLEFDRLRVTIGNRPILREVTLTVATGEAVGLVGESGSGKSMTVKSVLRMLPAGAAAGGTIRLLGAEIGKLDEAALRNLRSRDVAMVFQDPRATVNPVRTIGDFLTEVLRDQGVSKAQARQRAAGLLADVGVDHIDRRMRQRPHELSGGLLQRVVIAAALATEPKLILADEPTTALDVTTQEEVVAILDEQRHKRGTALLFISHDLELAAAVCDRIAVMYAGEIVEILPAARLHEDARHPYTRALLRSRPGAVPPGARLETVPGTPQAAFDAPAGCVFADRCGHATANCFSVRPVLRPVDSGSAACHLLEESPHGA
ncbi:ABC di/oligopeptide transporter ATPase [Actinoplanes ianthinogenes]|uniref:ABC di/oligopeptide transporter ATPase n=1 Tax=Actinoplanes ianthinogenes TaxID=122358 RepID=A0ABM7LN70_9ACTN|nr:ABC transporter ATP-binding protein [Actinoplanes ianthinogenes]BCJ40741.1 ABC di/oligopeptide transporter ATPase [Actinoplanes ianthinogenes]GGR43215.1 ABC di/oligopeptide transporter ATPase [Actinoplanes ianthinogenes]